MEFKGTNQTSNRNIMKLDRTDTAFLLDFLGLKDANTYVKQKTMKQIKNGDIDEELKAKLKQFSAYKAARIKEVNAKLKIIHAGRTCLYNLKDSVVKYGKKDKQTLYKVTTDEKYIKDLKELLSKI